MKTLSLLTLPVLGLLYAASAKPDSCPLLGQAYPPPVKLSKEPDFQKLTKGLEAYFSKDLNEKPFNQTTFSVGIFSASEHNLWQWHHPSADLSAKTNTSGKPIVDGNSVYEIGSASKLLTVYMWLITQGDRAFSHPIAEYIPDLLEASAQWNPLTPDWSQITVGDLAAQMGGLARDYGLNDLAVSLAQASGVSKSIEAAFPKLSPKEVPKCGWSNNEEGFVTCTVPEYIEGVVTESPIFPIAYTPVYSNEGFALLGVALQNITSKPLNSILEESLVQPLGLTGTYGKTPSNVTNHDVIPGGAIIAGWKENFGPWSGAGGFFSTVNDFATIGQSILNSQLVPQSTINRWLKPASFVESFEKGVGRPWEIFRLEVHGQTVDVYSKSGDALFALIPQYDIGVTILTAFDTGSRVGDQVRDAIAAAILEELPAVVDDIAKAQASTNFAGTYKSTETNSSLTIEVDSNGLVVSAWVNEGVDIFKAIFEEDVPNIDYRILPNNLYEGNEVGFTSFYQSAGSAGSPLLDCLGWLLVDQLTLGNIPLGQMVFQTDSSGKAVSVNTRAFRTTLERNS